MGSEMCIRDRIGPTRATPLVVAAGERPHLMESLAQQLEQGLQRETDGIFLWLRSDNRSARGASGAEAEILARLGSFAGGASLQEIAVTKLAQNVIRRLISAGAIGISTFTPTDAAQILGVDKRYPADAAVIGGRLLARQLDRFGVPLAANETALALSLIHI